MGAVELGFVALDLRCPICGHSWVLVGPMDMQRTVCPGCEGEIPMGWLADMARCRVCLRVPDGTVRGEWPCPACGQPRILNEVMRWS